MCSLQYFLAADEDAKNSVVVRVLQMLTVLIKYGYYDDPAHVNELLPSIHKLLNGCKDYPTRQIKQASELSFKGEIQRSKQESTIQSHVSIDVPFGGLPA